MQNIAQIFIGFDYRERAAMNVLIDSLYNKSSIPISITPLITNQLNNKGIYYRKKDPNQSTDFSFSRFLVPFLMNYKDWALFIDCDMLAYGDIAELWDQRDNNYSVLCAKHNHDPIEKIKFLGEKQTKYERKNWSSMMLFNCKKCTKLTVKYVNEATGLDLHRFKWLKNTEIGEINREKWNYLIGIDKDKDEQTFLNKPNLVHWTLGGPWFKQNRNDKCPFSKDWFTKRNESIRLWD